MPSLGFRGVTFDRPAVRRFGGSLLWAGAGIGLGYAARFLLIEPESLGRTCVALDAPSWCLPRQAVIWFFHQNVIGLMGIAAGAAALVGLRRPGWRPWIRRWRARETALVLGGLALTLHNAALGSVAAVLGLLAAMDEV